ncbi:hypothetical protein SAMN06297251_11249 [Fulvimarina manganoxydans]|uniref:Uncharacterized protein n=1 Tax=Fulvimarina manganoxydans TaxID=937218 RepID=A0A1W2D186_9HYPH|nr:hypothetical protein [Fulvimarina manganoxydans]MEE2951936.1 hypothetical protein [Pseudomonadota bacterium]SMC91279.1 hypothetical protein SAMN06297251_11249 [Fulvimarina manganoxydans]
MTSRSKDRTYPIFDIGDPAPDREKISDLALLAIFSAGPIAWSLQLFFGSAASGIACIGGDGQKLDAASLSWATPAMIGVTIIALLVALAAFAVSILVLRRTGDREPSNEESVMEAGQGRTRFVAIWSIWANGLFALAVAVNLLAYVWGDLCGV